MSKKSEFIEKYVCFINRCPIDENYHRMTTIEERDENKKKITSDLDEVIAEEFKINTLKINYRDSFLYICCEIRNSVLEILELNDNDLNEHGIAKSIVKSAANINVYFGADLSENSDIKI